jgi:hypothetical protein
MNSGVVEKSVHTAYRVFDEYVQCALRTAALYKPSEGEGTTMNETQDMAAMAMRYWSEMAKAWMGPWAQFSPLMNWAGQAGDNSWDLGGPGAAAPRTAAGVNAASPRRVAISVEITSSQPAEVTVDLGERAPSKTIAAQPLRAIDDDAKPPLSAIQLEFSEGKLSVLATVPRDQPAGVYTGAIVDREKSQVLGTLTVSLRAPK